MANLISTTGPICPNVTNTPLDNRSRVSTVEDIGNIPLAWKGMLVYCEDNGNTYKVTSLKSKISGPVVIENYYPATWIEFGSGGGTPSPSPSPSAASAGDITYENGGSYTTGTVGSKLNEIGNLNDLEITSNSIVGVINILKQAVDGKISGIIVDGQQLPIDNDGIVTIPAGGGGTGTITGATIGGNPVTESGGVLKFPAYPTVPITGIKDANNNTLTPDGGIVTLPTIPTVPISSIAKKTNDTNPITPNQGRVNLDLTAEDIAYNTNKTIKGKLNDIDKLIKDLTPDPSESSSTTIDLNLYSEWEDDESEYHSFIYDSSAIYVYETSSTSRITKTVSNVSHAVFKVSDRDIYIDYIISTSGNDTIYTANAIYNSSTLPSDFKEQFELGVYALIYRIIGRSGDSIPYGKTIIADTENKVLNVVYRDVVDGGVTKHQLIARSFDKNRIYIYETPDATYTRGYKFKISYGTVDSGFSELNELFGTSSANYNIITPTDNVTSYSIANPTKNTYYDLSSLNLTSLALTSVNLTNINEVVVKFTTDSTNTCTISAPANVKFIGNSALYKGTTYVLAMLYGVICICEVPSLT